MRGVFFPSTRLGLGRNNKSGLDSTRSSPDPDASQPISECLRRPHQSVLESPGIQRHGVKLPLR